MTSIKDRCIFGSFMILLLLSYGLLAQDLSLSGLARVRNGRSAAVTSSEPDFRSNLDRVTYIKPGETLVMADIPGPAVIQHIWLTFNEARPNWLEKGGSANPSGLPRCRRSETGSFPTWTSSSKART